MRLRDLVVVVGAIATTGGATSAYARSEVCKRVSEKEIAGLFDRWNASLQTGDARKVVANYAAKSVLLPTLSNQPRLSAAEKEDYFEHFLQRKPVGAIDWRSIEVDCRSIDYRAGIRIMMPPYWPRQSRTAATVSSETLGLADDFPSTSRRFP